MLTFFRTMIRLFSITLVMWGMTLNGVQAQDESLKPFYHGVASGDPLEDRVIIWTRVTPEAEGSIEVQWTIATDPELSNVVNSGTVTTDASVDYTVKVDATGLMPGQTYYYGFAALGANSIIGRTKTVPDGDTENLRFAVVSCNNYQHGYFNGFAGIAERSELAAVIHLGDYIYEYSATGDDRYGDPGLLAAGKRLHTPDAEILSVEDYRVRYGQYRLDADLRKAHQMHPFITIWDDHESTNDSYTDGAENHQPDTEGPWEERKNRAKQVYTEWMPVRGDLTTEVLYRTIPYGNLMDLILLDTRLEGRDVTDNLDPIVDVTNPGMYAEDRQILGEEQEAWLKNQLTSSTAKWKVIANQIVFADFNSWWIDPNPVAGQNTFLDFWDGYPAAKDRIINFIDDNNIDNVVIVTGDFHCSLASDIASEPAVVTGVDPAIPTTGIVPFPVEPNYNPETQEGSVAVEFATPGLTSANFDEFFRTQGLDSASAVATSFGFAFQTNNPLPADAGPVAGVNPNPHIKFVDYVNQGYLILDVKSGRTQADWYYVNSVLIPNSGERFAGGFGTNDGENRVTPGPETAPEQSTAFTLQLLHASDLEGGVDAIENAPNFAAIVDAIEEDVDNTVIISGGDNYIPGPFFGAASDFSLTGVFQDVYQDLFGEPGLTNIRSGSGRADITIMNIIGFDASAVGNHEFDAGPNAFEGLISTDIRGNGLGDIRWLGAQFPYLSSNLDFSNDGDLASSFTSEILPNTAFQSTPSNAVNTPDLAQATIIERNGERIGVVGATTQRLELITSNGGVEVIGAEDDDIAVLATQVQAVVDSLTAMGINKIILTTHLQQLALEKELATLVSGVDIIVAGGSDQIFANGNIPLREGDQADEPYPVVSAGADGNPVLIVGTDGEYTYVGRLIVNFDENGVVDVNSLTNPLNGAYPTTNQVVDFIAGTEAFAENSKGELVKRLTDAISAIADAQSNNFFGSTDVFLEGRRSAVRTEETNIGNLTADANLAVAKTFDSEVKVSLKNGGGIRAAIGEIVDLGNGQFEALPPQPNGDVSELDIKNTLRFNNGLSILSLTAEQLLQVIEHGVADSDPGNEPGRFPQVGGMRFSFNPGLPANSRVGFLEIIAEDGSVEDVIAQNGQLVGDPNRIIKIVTLDFLAGGGDGYPYPSFTNANRVDLEDVLTEDNATFADIGSEQDALARFLAANFSTTPFNTAETPVSEDTRILRDTEFVLQLLHASDLEGGVDAIENAPNFAAIVDAIEEDVDNTVIISGGDNYIPGPFFGAASDFSLTGVFQDVYQDLFNEPGLTNIRSGSGRADITIMNIIGFDASTVGNHEFDAGPNAFEGLISTDIRGNGLGDIRWLGAQFPYLSSNLDFSNDGDLASSFTSEILPNTAFQSTPSNAVNTPDLAQATIIERNGEKIGVVGATTQRFELITSNGGVEVIGAEDDDIAVLATQVQAVVDSLTAMGVNKIILTTHLQQLALEKELATLVSGVDIIVAGGSDQLFAQSDDILRSGDVADEAYPFVSTGADGNPVLIVGTDGEYSYVGRLIVTFDENGVVDVNSAANAINGAYATISDVVDDIAGENAFAENSKGELVKRLTDAISAIVEAQSNNFFGKTDVFLEGRRSAVRTEETNLGNLTADANLVIAKTFDSEVKVSLKNGGGIRAAIGEIVDLGNGQFEPLAPQPNGDISELDIKNTLRFNNGLSILSLTAEQLLQVIEHSVADSDPGNQPGRFPQIAGLRFTFDAAKPMGSRVGSMEVIAEDGSVEDVVAINGQLVGDANRIIKIVTLDFLAGGGDGYPYPSFTNANRVDLEDILPEDNATFADIGSEQDALARFLAANFSTTPFNTAEVATSDDGRIINEGAERASEVLSFVVVDAPSDEVRFVLNEGDIINVVDFPGGFNIVAIAAPSQAGVVSFSLNGEAQGQEANAPYALFGNTGFDFRAGTLPVGAYNLVATPSRQGNQGIAAEVNFEVVNNANVTIAGFELFNADTDNSLGAFANGATIDLNAIGTNNLSIVASVEPASEVGSVFIEPIVAPNGFVAPRNRTESKAPYAFGGNEGNDFTGVSLIPGDYVIRFTPFTGLNRTGLAGFATEVAFTVTGNVSNLTVFPNPNNGIFNVSSNLVVNGGELVILDRDGNVILTKPFSGALDMEIDMTAMPIGVYTIIVNSNGQQLQDRVILGN